VVASFLALLELYREDAVSFEQVAPLGELYVTWTGSADTGDTDSVDELTESDDDQ
jgi:segregation and condensation protein A